MRAWGDDDASAPSRRKTRSRSRSPRPVPRRRSEKEWDHRGFESLARGEDAVLGRSYAPGLQSVTSRVSDLRDAPFDGAAQRVLEAATAELRHMRPPSEARARRGPPKDWFASPPAVDFRTISSALWGLCNASDDCPAVMSFLEVLQPWIVAASPAMNPSNPRVAFRNISKALYGLRGCSASQPAVRSVIGALVPFVESSHLDYHSEVFASASIGLYGLNKSDAEWPEVRAMIGALTGILRCETRGGAPVTAHSISHALYGLRSSSASVDEVRECIASITPVVSRVQDSPGGVEISHVLYGLQHSSSAVPEVRALLGELARFVRRFNGGEIEGFHVGDAIYGLKKCSSEHAEVRDMLSVLAPLAARATKWCPAAISSGLCGLQSCSASHSEVRVMLSILAGVVSTCTEPMSGGRIGYALSGLRGCSSDWPETRAVLSALVPVIQRSSDLQAAGEEGAGGLRYKDAIEDDGDGASFGVSFYGLAACGSEHAEVRAVLGALSARFARVRGRAIAPLAILNALYGIQGCASEVLETRMALAAILRHMEACTAPFPSRGIGGAFYGLQRCSSEHGVTRALLRALAIRLTSLDPRGPPPESWGVGNMLYGLQSCTSEHAEVREAIAAITPHVEHLAADSPSVAPLDGLGLSTALFGLQNCSGEHSEVRAVIRALEANLAAACRRGPFLLTPQQVGISLVGLRGVAPATRAPLVRHLVSRGVTLVDELTIACGGRGGATTAQEDDIQCLADGAIALLYPPPWIAPAAEPDEPELLADLRRIYDVATAILTHCTPAQSISRQEAWMRRVSQELFARDPDVRVEAGARYLCGHEADIVIYVRVQAAPDPSRSPQGGGAAVARCSGGMQEITLDVEVDGAFHRRFARRRTDTVRDAHLAQRGVRVARWDVSRATPAPTRLPSDAPKAPAVGGADPATLAFKTWLRVVVDDLRHVAPVEAAAAEPCDEGAI